MEAKTGRHARERLPPTRPTKPGRLERWACADIRHGTLALLATCAVATGKVIAPSRGATRTEADFATQRKRTLETAPEAAWSFVVDQWHMHQSASVVRLVAARCERAVDVGVTGASGIVPSMATRAACRTEATPRMRLVYTPTHASWLNPVERWCSLLVRRLLPRASFPSVEDLRERGLACMEYCNATVATPFQWTDKGRPLAVEPVRDFCQAILGALEQPLSATPRSAATSRAWAAAPTAPAAELLPEAARKNRV
jgi:DDE superfamily endonuclease